MDFDELDAFGTEEAVRVFVRIRPLNKREIAEKQTIGWNFNETSMLEDTPNGQRVYAYDHCFGPTASNQETYDIVGKPVVLKAMEGYNGTVFTYGQTGSGKTWTMRGNEQDPGMMVLCVRDIMEWVKNHPEIQFTLKISYLEVYNEEINDLLGDQSSASKNLKIVSEDAVRGAVIGNLVEESATCPEDFMAILRRGEASRSYASTNMNAESSRSHTIYRVTIEAREKNSLPPDSDDATETPPGRISYLNLVDLAGSERQKSTKAEGKVLKEGANINKSLLALGAVINKLGELSKKVKGAKAAFIPYRDSKLTRILKQSLGGNTLTSILCAVTPAPMHREETVSTLKFGQSCKNIKNNVKANDGIVDDKTLIKQYRATINELRTQVEELSAGKYVASTASLDPESALGQAMLQKNDLENRIRGLENLLLNKGATASEIAAILQNSSVSSNNRSAETEAEIIKLNEKLAEQQKLLTKLQRTLGEYQDLEESKANFEEYEHHIRQELDEETTKLEEEKLTLQNERYKLLKDRSAIDEKESRIGLLLTNLDEKESKLRQLLANMKEQQDQWGRSVTDLQKREDLVDDWQRNHKQREKKLQEIEVLQEKKFQELNKRESFISEEENRLKLFNKELSEREQRLQIGLSRVTNQETINNQKEEVLSNQENNLKKKEHECDIRERELLSRRKELESWDVLLREKDRKIQQELRSLDERESSIRSIEEKTKSKEMEIERKTLEINKQEIYYQEMMSKYTSLITENEEINKEIRLKSSEYEFLLKDLNSREEELKKWEKSLLKLQEYLKNIEAREQKLLKAEQLFHEKETEFYQVKIAQITSRHNNELKSLEEIIQKQLKITQDFQKELNELKQEVNHKNETIHDLENLLEQRNQVIDNLKDTLRSIESGTSNQLRNSLASNLSHSNNNNGANNNTNSPSSSTAGGDGYGLGAGSGELGSTTSQAQQAPASAMKDLHAHLHDNNNKSAANPFDAKGIRGNGNNSNAMEMVNSNLHPHNFITQLAITRNILYQVLDKYDAIPDPNMPVRRRPLDQTQKKKSSQRLSEERRPRVHHQAPEASSSNGSTAVEENKDSSPPPPPPPGDDNQPAQPRGLTQLFPSPVPPQTGLHSANSMKSLSAALNPLIINVSGSPEAPQPAAPGQSQAQHGKARKGGTIFVPAQDEQPQQSQPPENTRASVTVMMSELAADFHQKVGPGAASSATPGYSNGRNQGIIGLKKAPVTPNTLNSPHHQQQQGSPLGKTNLSSPLHPAPSSAHAHHAHGSAKKSSKNSTAVFGEALSSIVTVGDYDEEGVPVTTVNLGLKSKRIVKNLATPTTSSHTNTPSASRSSALLSPKFKPT